MHPLRCVEVLGRPRALVSGDLVGIRSFWIGAEEGGASTVPPVVKPYSPAMRAPSERVYAGTSRLTGPVENAVDGNRQC